MSATFTVEDGTGLPNANAYASVAYADQYNLDYTDDAVWIAASVEDKEAALRRATRYLDTFYAARWRGVRKRAAQALAWPRVNAWDDDGYAIDDTSVPSEAADAVSVLAVKDLNGETLMPDESSGVILRERDKVGPLETEVEYMGGKDEVVRFTLVDRLVQTLIHSNNRVIRA